MEKLLCKHCKVEVISREDLRPKHIGTEHGKKCPRRFKSFHPKTRVKK